MPRRILLVENRSIVILNLFSEHEQKTPRWQQRFCLGVHGIHTHHQLFIKIKPEGQRTQNGWSSVEAAANIKVSAWILLEARWISTKTIKKD